MYSLYIECETDYSSQRFRLNNDVQTFNAFKAIVTERTNNYFSNKEEDAPEIKTIHYKLLNQNGVFELISDQDVLNFNLEDSVTAVIVNYDHNKQIMQQKRQRSELKEEDLQSQSNDSAAISSLTQAMSNLNTKVLSKAALDVNQQFSGKTGTVSLVNFKYEIQHHQKTYELSDEIIFKQLMAG